MPESSGVLSLSGGDDANSRRGPSSSSDRPDVISDCRLVDAEGGGIGEEGDEGDEEEYEEIEVEVYEEIEEEIEVDDDEVEEVEEVEAGEEEVEAGEEEVEEIEEEEEEEEVEREAEEVEEEVEIEEEVEELVEEEIEVEEEEEEEEEIEQEAEEDMPDTSKEANAVVEEEEEKGEDMLDTLKGANAEKDDQHEEEDVPNTSKEAKCSDNGQVFDFDGNDGQPESNSPPKTSELGPHSGSIMEDNNFNSASLGPSNELLAKKDESCVSGEHLITAGKNGSEESTTRMNEEKFMVKETTEGRRSPHSFNEAHFNDSEVAAAETNSQFTNVAYNALVMQDCLDMKPDNTINFQEEVKPIEKQSEDYEENTTSRFSGLFTSERKDPSKHLEVICDFFAKGWCIRGSSCRFLHIKNKEDETLYGDSKAALFSKSDQSGLRHVLEKPKVSSNHDLVVSSVGNDDIDSCDFLIERKFQLETKEKQKLHQLDDKDKYLLLQQGLGFSSSKDIGIQNHRERWLSGDYESFGSPVNRGNSPSQNSLLPEHRSYLSGSAATLNNHHGLSSSYSSSLEHQIYLRSRSLRETKFHDSISSNHTLPSHSTSAWTGSSFSFGSSLNKSPFGSRKLLGNDTDCTASIPCSLLPSASPLSDSGGGYHRRNVSPIDGVSSSLQHNRLLPERRSYVSGSAATISKYYGLNSSSCSSSTETQTYIRSQSGHRTKGDDSLSSSCRLPFHQSASTGSSFSFGSCLNRRPLAQNMLPNDRDYDASKLFSFLQSASPLSGSDRGNLPFHPSSTITPPSSLDTRIDHLGDKSDLPPAGIRLPFDVLFSTRGNSSVDILKQPVYNKSSESGPDGPQNDAYGTGTVTGENCVVNGENGSMPDEEIGSSNVLPKDVPNASTTRDSKGHDEGHRHKKIKVNADSQNSEMEVDKKSHGESKATRQFRIALVDVVKELLKPAWHEGHLSKDAHNMIVKKAEEKVLGSLEAHQIPCTPESVKLYLSASQPKIAKLVEGYCAKYKKS